MQYFYKWFFCRVLSRYKGCFIKFCNAITFTTLIANFFKSAIALKISKLYRMYVYAGKKRKTLKITINFTTPIAQKPLNVSSVIFLYSADFKSSNKPEQMSLSAVIFCATALSHVLNTKHRKKLAYDTCHIDYYLRFRRLQ